MRNRLSHASRGQRGLTLIELLVALGLGLVVVVIAATALLLGQQGYRAVDTTTQLRDRERFATDLLGRVIIQAGYQDLGAANLALRSTATLLGIDPEPDIFGWNNAVYATPDDLILSESTKIVNGNRPGACSVNDTSCKNGSDVLVIRYQGVSSPTSASDADDTMINCRGEGEAGLLTGDLNDRAVSVFHVTRDISGEPSLSCSYYNFSSGAWVASAPLIEGVESFQVLYGTDGVVPTLAPSASAVQDTVAERWLRADELTVAGNAAGTRENWRRVRAVRVGLVLRGAAGSAQQSATATLTPLGSMYASTSDTGSSLAVAADGRLRQQSTFTVHLRNDLRLR
ncbi:PilW family protein [Polaromonas sp.]|jgi:type IV pilus assembly protein PilW|uniref:PilW family protein n=1 Tax=Polaromonas sp. TaxID=1869339 RepID=UPI0037C94D38